MNNKQLIHMKNILAFIRIDKMNETKKALSDVDLPSFTATGKVLGRGKGKWDAKVMEGAKQDRPEALALLDEQPRLRPHRLISITVPDDKVKTAVNAIIESNRTHSPGDGKIFVIPITESISIRTGNSGNAVLD